MVETKPDLRHFFEVSLDLLCIANVEGYFLQVNPAFERTLGYSIDELIRRPFLEFVHHEDKQNTLSEVAKLSTGEPTIFFENRYMHKNGTYRWLSWTCSPDPDTGLLYAVARDVTDRKQKELRLQEKNEQLEESEKYFKDLADSSPVLLWMSSLKKSFTHFNQSWLNFTGRTLNQEKSGGWLQGIHPDDQQSFQYYYNSYFDSRLPFKMEFRLRRNDGEYRWLLNTGVPRYDELGEFVGFIGSCIDISEEKRLLTAHVELLKRLSASNKMLENANQSLEQFAYIATHDLQGPISSLKVLIDIWNHRCDDPREIHNIMNGLQSGILYLHNSLQGLLSSLKIYKGFKEEPQEINIEDAYQEIEGAIHDLILESKAEIMTDFEDFPVVKYVPIHLKSILMNLVTNAIKYRAEERTPQILIKTAIAEDRPWLMVKDNGLGIDLDKFGKDMFKLNKRFHDHVKGNGIGLFNIKSIVDSYNGKIQVDSSVGAGTTFKIYF